MVAHAPGLGQAFPLGSHLASSPRLALRWLRRRAGELSDQLDPQSAQPLRAWLADPAEHERALATLADGHPYTLTTHDDTGRYLSILSLALPTACRGNTHRDGESCGADDQSQLSSTKLSGSWRSAGSR